MRHAPKPTLQKLSTHFMEDIIQPVERHLLKAELTPEHRLRSTNKSNNEIYVVTYQQAPNVLREIGRLREIAFRAAGGGTGKALDLDEFDTCEHPYYQLIVWCPEDEQILGGYRFLPSHEIQFEPSGQPHLATGHMFHFSQQFIDNYLSETERLDRVYSMSRDKHTYAVVTTDTGLTDGQIIGIVLAACCALVTVAVVLFAKKAKRAY